MHVALLLVRELHTKMRLFCEASIPSHRRRNKHISSNAYTRHINTHSPTHRYYAKNHYTTVRAHTREFDTNFTQPHTHTRTHICVLFPNNFKVMILTMRR